MNVKIPITNTKKQSTSELVGKLSSKGVVCNITAIFTLDQVSKILDVLDDNTPAILSIFAGRIADTGIDPSGIISEAVQLSKKKTKNGGLMGKHKRNTQY